jgi:glycosyltransferase involved in cell wall biosynthesis
MSSKVCVIIPAYNASGTVADVIKGALKYVSKVIVADDGSVDDTATAASEAGAEVIRLKKNRGKGNALKALFKRAIDDGYEAVISLDADGQHDPADIPLFLEANSKYPADIIVGSRMHDKDKIPRARYNSMHIARFFISFASNQFLEDTQCGYRLYPLNLIKKIRLTTERYTTESELLIKAGDTGVNIRFVRIRTIYGNNGSHFRPVADMAGITAYVIFYLQVKWLIEAVTPDNPNTYSSGGRLRDLIGSHFISQVLTVLTALPASILFLTEYIVLGLIIPNNFSSVRKLEKGFAKITIAAQMLPVVLVVAIFEKLVNVNTRKIKLLDRMIQNYFPNLWEM